MTWNDYLEMLKLLELEQREKLIYELEVLEKDNISIRDLLVNLQAFARLSGIKPETMSQISLWRSSYHNISQKMLFWLLILRNRIDKYINTLFKQMKTPISSKARHLMEYQKWKQENINEECIENPKKESQNLEP